MFLHIAQWYWYIFFFQYWYINEHLPFWSWAFVFCSMFMIWVILEKIGSDWFESDILVNFRITLRCGEDFLNFQIAEIFKCSLEIRAHNCNSILVDIYDYWFQQHSWWCHSAIIKKMPINQWNYVRKMVRMKQLSFSSSSQQNNWHYNQLLCIHTILVVSTVLQLQLSCNCITAHHQWWWAISFGGNIGS